ncbi:MAG: glycosyltransferase [Ardenticatenaceae bacterium]|nr:glycosyltransferase [Ardenticatenaceae bacterium]
MKLFYLITDLEIGGAQTMLVQVLRHLDRERFLPVVACFYGGDSPLADEIRALDIPVIDLGMRAKWRLDGLWRLYQALRRERPFLLHASLFHANIPARILGRLARVPVIVTWRQNISIGGPWRERINRWTAPLDDQVTAVCQLAQQAEIEGTAVSPQKVSLIYNCIDAAPFAIEKTDRRTALRQALDIPAAAPLIGVVGRLHPQKGVGYLLEAFPRIREEMPEARLLIVGDGEMRDAWQTRAQALEIDRDVIFAGARHDIPDILTALDLFVLPSLWEGLPLAILEAMAAGLPVVATNVGGVPELVINGETGRLVPPGDVDALAQAVLAVLRRPAQAAATGAAGRARVLAEFSAATTTRQLTALYLRLAKAKGYQQ